MFLYLLFKINKAAMVWREIKEYVVVGRAAILLSNRSERVKILSNELVVTLQKLLNVSGPQFLHLYLTSLLRIERDNICTGTVCG